jgi:long-chain fatty acid transport protein
MALRLPVLTGHVLLAAIALAIGPLPARAQIGPILTGEGAVNRSMGGASVAAPLDSVGATYWNPATTSSVRNSMDLGVELSTVQTRLFSSLPANALGAGIPAVPLSGTQAGDNGVAPLPAIGLVYRPDGSPWTFGLGTYAVAGFSVNYPGSLTNPILTAQPPNGVGLGPLFASLQVMQIAPTLALQVTPRLSLGGGPMLNLALLQADPFFLAAPNADGTFPSGTHSRYSWGGGFQVGAYYKLDGGWRLGASFKSPQWFEPFQFQTADALGRPRFTQFRAELPLIPSVGIAYAGFDGWLLAADFRYVDFGDANGLRQTGFDASGAARGLGWQGVFAMALGAQYQLTDAASLRLGYTFNQNPIANEVTSFNVASPTILEHTLYAGASYHVSETFKLSLGYVHGFKNSVAGPLVTPLGAVPGSSVRITAWGDTFMLGASVNY